MQQYEPNHPSYQRFVTGSASVVKKWFEKYSATMR
jgi:hypothetical protein